MKQKRSTVPATKWVAFALILILTRNVTRAWTTPITTRRALQTKHSYFRSHGSFQTRPVFVHRLDNTPFNHGDFSSEAFTSAAATAIKLSCPLLGIKSIGVDYGLVRTGVAVTVGFQPRPLQTIVETNATNVAIAIVSLCQTHKPTNIVVGWPLHKNGTEAAQTKKTRKFVEELTKQVWRELGEETNVVVWDERYTSKEATARLQSTQRLRGTLDAESACIILESFYSEGGMKTPLSRPKVLVPDGVRRSCLATYEENSRLQKAAQDTALRQRADRIQRRREAIAQSKELDIFPALDVGKKKRKKRKRR